MGVRGVSDREEFVATGAAWRAQFTAIQGPTGWSEIQWKFQIGTMKFETGPRPQLNTRGAEDDAAEGQKLLEAALATRPCSMVMCFESQSSDAGHSQS